MAGPEAEALSGTVTIDLSSDAHIKAALAIQVSAGASHKASGGRCQGGGGGGVGVLGGAFAALKCFRLCE